MRLFLAFVIILNLLYAGWEYVNPTKTREMIPPLADNLQSLELLREAESIVEVPEHGAKPFGTLPIDVGQPEQAAVEESGEPGQVPIACYTLGPFKDSDLMKQVKASLTEYVDNLTVRTRQETERHRYWVYIPSLGSRRKAKSMVSKLRDSKVKDFYIILNGEQRNGVSLGHFKERRHASRRHKKITGLGFKADIEVIYKELDIHWLDYQSKSQQSDPAFDINEYAIEGVSQLVRDCEKS